MLAKGVLGSWLFAIALQTLRLKLLWTDHDFVRPGGQLELHSALLVLLERGGYVEVSDLNGPRPGACRPIVGFGVDHAADDRIAAYLFAVTITINKDGGRRLDRLLRCSLYRRIQSLLR